jgi:hypothetical protein
MALPKGLELGLFAFHAGWTIEPHTFTLLVSNTVGQFIIPSFHPVTGHLQMLAVIVTDFVQMVHQICCIIDRWLLLVWRCPNKKLLGNWKNTSASTTSTIPAGRLCGGSLPVGIEKMDIAIKYNTYFGLSTIDLLIFVTFKLK